MRRLVTIDLRRADLGLFESDEARVPPLVANYGGRLEFRVRAVDAASWQNPARAAARDEWVRSGASAVAIEVVAFASNR
jgi:hypothetical protein